MRTLHRPILAALLCLGSVAFVSCTTVKGIRPYGRAAVTAFPVLVDVFVAGNQCIATTSANHLQVWGGDTVEFFVRSANEERCPSRDVKIDEWTRRDGKKEKPVRDVQGRGNANIEVLPNPEFKKHVYKYTIIVGAARLDPELEIMKD